MRNTIKIKFHCYNHHAMDFGMDIANIIDAAHKSEVVEVQSMGEPFDYEKIEWKGTKFLDILKSICKKNNWPLEKFHLVSNNLLQDESVWPVITKKFYGGPFLRGGQLSIDVKKEIKKHFGIFINNSSWPRLWISSYLFSKHHEKTFQSFVRDIRNPSHAANLDLDALMFHFSSAKLVDRLALDNVFNLLSKVPITIGQFDTACQNDQHFNTDFELGSHMSPLSRDLMECYQNIFCDVVCETMFSGRIFSIDEKISRCLLTETPFIIFGASKQLQNLKKLGFKTFSNHWDESYDHCSDAERCVEISKLLDYLSKFNIDQLKEIYDNMKPILKHNKSMYLELCSKKDISAYLNSIEF